MALTPVRGLKWGIIPSFVDYTHVDHNQIDDPLPFKIICGSDFQTVKYWTRHVLEPYQNNEYTANRVTTSYISFKDLVTVEQENSTNQIAEVLVEE